MMDVGESIGQLTLASILFPNILEGAASPENGESEREGEREMDYE